ncbi:MAG: hypothetical protein M9884_09515 [Rhodocyclaceae bacterium]|jgi:hypothetical protein|nr:hypothetical protein [Rhodocyclaceae bacterium]MCO5097693.1 hypothetical protein [Rhodocyclaceae bacterium]MCZ7653319.1 hypothetical protein [Rhodocyclaceae bacterium]
MGKYEKLLQLVLGGRSDANVAFGELRQLLLRLGFAERIRGDHHIYSREGVEEILNLQPRGGMAKPYQVKQVRSVILRYGMGADDE